MIGHLKCYYILITNVRGAKILKLQHQVTDEKRWTFESNRNFIKSVVLSLSLFRTLYVIHIAPIGLITRTAPHAFWHIQEHSSSQEVGRERKCWRGITNSHQIMEWSLDVLNDNVKAQSLQAVSSQLYCGPETRQWRNGSPALQDEVSLH